MKLLKRKFLSCTYVVLVGSFLWISAACGSSLSETENTEIASSQDTQNESVATLDTKEDSEQEESTEEESTEEVSPYTFDDMDATKYASSAVNVRDLPCEEGMVLGELPLNESVHVIGQCKETGWYKIEYNDGIGYVSNNLISDTQTTFDTSANENSDASANNGGGNNYSDKPTSIYGLSDDEICKYDYSRPITEVLYPNKDDVTDEIFARLNEYRASEGLSTLQRDPMLDQIAVIRANDMAQNDYFDHRVDGILQAKYVARHLGYENWLNVGENILWMGCDDLTDLNLECGSTFGEASMYSWKHSPMHDRNMKIPNWTKCGFGAITYNGQFWAVQLFCM